MKKGVKIDSLSSNIYWTLIIVSILGFIYTLDVMWIIAIILLDIAVGIHVSNLWRELESNREDE